MKYLQKQATLNKLAQTRLAINYVLRSRYMNKIAADMLDDKYYYPPDDSGIRIRNYWGLVNGCPYTKPTLERSADGRTIYVRGASGLDGGDTMIIDDSTLQRHQNVANGTGYWKTVGTDAMFGGVGGAGGGGVAAGPAGAAVGFGVGGVLGGIGGLFHAASRQGTAQNFVDTAHSARKHFLTQDKKNGGINVNGQQGSPANRRQLFNPKSF